jgi:hypothetical protein
MSVSYGPPLSAEWIQAQGTGKAAYKKIAATVMERIGELREAAARVK